MKTIRVVVKALLVTPTGRTLLIRRSASDHRRPLQWDIPGGAADQGEDFRATACRETEEEAGIVISGDSLTLGYATAANTEKGNVCWLFFVAPLETEAAVKLSEEHDDYKWVMIDEALELITYERQQQAIRHIQQYVLA